MNHIHISKLIAVAIPALFMPVAAFAQTNPVKIYILAGQSNMNTFNYSLNILKEAYPGLAIPTENIWYVDGGIRSGLPQNHNSWGVETPFAVDLVKGVQQPILVFKSSEGGTTLSDQWRPPGTVKRSGGEVGHLYNRMIRRFHNMISNIETICPPAKERGYEIAGFLWFQGESDAASDDPEGWKDYEQKLRELIADVRRDTGVPELPYLNIMINNMSLWDGTPEKPKGGPTIRAAQKKVAEEDPKGRWISTSDLSSGYHYDAPAHLVIGQRMAEAMLPLAKEIVPTDPAKVEAAGKAFRERTYPSAKPDVSSLRNGLVFYLAFEQAGQPSVTDLVSGAKGNIIGNVEHSEGLFGKAAYIEWSRNQANRIEFPDFKDPLKDGTIHSLSVSFWVQTPSGHVGDAIAKYQKGKAHNSMEDGWRMIIDSYGKSGMNAIIDTTAPGSGPEPAEGGRMLVAARPAGPAAVDGDGVEWHHLVSVFDGDARTMRTYVNAQMTPNPKRYPWAKDLPGKGIVSSANPLTLHSCSRNAAMRSAMDELAIWNRALTEDEIKALFNNGNGVPILNQN